MRVLLVAFLTLMAALQASDAIAQTDAMHYTELQDYLPKSINGYQSGEPDGQTFTMGGMSYSSAEMTYTGDKGIIRITILDYAAAAAMYQAATAVWSTGMSFEDNQTKAQSVQLSENIAGWEEYRKDSQEAHLALGVGNRFFISIEAENQSDVSFVHEIAGKMKLEQLSSK